MCWSSLIKKYAYNNRGFLFGFFSNCPIHEKRMFLTPSKWYYRTDCLIMDLVCYKYSVEGEEIPPSIRELGMEKLRTKFCKTALFPQSCGDSLWSTLLRAQHRLCHILKLLELLRGGQVLLLLALPHVGRSSSLCPNH